MCKEVRQEADPRLWWPVKAEDLIGVSEVWLFVLIQCTIAHTWAFYRGKLVMNQISNLFLLMHSIVLKLLKYEYVTFASGKSISLPLWIFTSAL